jgi:hypothetical protein
MAKKTRKPAVWNRALAYPIKLRDGDVISTMAQAARLMTQRLPKARQEKPVWQHTAELLMAGSEKRQRNRRTRRHRSTLPRASIGRLDVTDRLFPKCGGLLFFQFGNLLLQTCDHAAHLSEFSLKIAGNIVSRRSGATVASDMTWMAAAVAMFFTCPSVAASLLLVPGATLTMRRRALWVPTETVSATLASEPLPIATDRALFATAPSPNVSAELALALAKRPSAVLPSPFACASVPTAVAAKAVCVEADRGAKISQAETSHAAGVTCPAPLTNCHGAEAVCDSPVNGVQRPTDRNRITSNASAPCSYRNGPGSCVVTSR